MSMKKRIALICGTVMIAGLSACGGSSAPTATTAAAKAAATTAKAEGTEATSAKSAEITKVAAAADGKDKEFSIDLATAYSKDGPAGTALAKFVEDVNKATNGSVQINLFTDGTLGNAKDNYSSVASGDLDMTMSGLEGLDLYAPEYTFLDCPFLMQSLDHQKKLLEGGIGEKLKKKYEDAGFVTLGWHNRDIRELAANKEVNAPADVNGMKLRLPGMTVYVDTWSALGVSSTTVAMNELYTALQTKVAEACEGGYEQMDTLKLYEVQKNIMETDHVYEFVGLYINKKLYDSMSDAQKQALNDCAREDLDYADKLATENRQKYKEDCLKGGMTEIKADRDAFRNALTDYYKKQFTDKWTVTTYDEVMSAAK